MSRIETMNGLQVSRTRKRLRVSRMFGLSLLSLPLFGASAWSSSTLFGPLLFLIGVLLAVTGFCGRLWCLSYVAGRKKKVLVTAGPYSLCRHPLYLFSFVGGLGLGLCTQTLSAAVLFALGFALYYPRAIRGEEAFLSDNFPDYKEYKRRVPRFVPRWSNFAEGDGKVSVGDFGREIVPAGSFLLLIGVFEMLDSLHAADLLPTHFLIP